MLDLQIPGQISLHISGRVIDLAEAEAIGSGVEAAVHWVAEQRRGRGDTCARQ